MDDMSSGDESDAEPMSTDMLEDIRGGIQYYPRIYSREAFHRIRDCLKKSQEECKGELLSM